MHQRLSRRLRLFIGGSYWLPAAAFHTWTLQLLTNTIALMRGDDVPIVKSSLTLHKFVLSRLSKRLALNQERPLVPYPRSRIGTASLKKILPVQSKAG